jgi:hypothetical protein
MLKQLITFGFSGLLVFSIGCSQSLESEQESSGTVLEGSQTLTVESSGKSDSIQQREIEWEARTQLERNHGRVESSINVSEVNQFRVRVESPVLSLGGLQNEKRSFAIESDGFLNELNEEVAFVLFYRTSDTGNWKRLAPRLQFDTVFRANFDGSGYYRKAALWRNANTGNVYLRADAIGHMTNGWVGGTDRVRVRSLEGKTGVQLGAFVLPVKARVGKLAGEWPFVFTIQ